MEGRFIKIDSFEMSHDVKAHLDDDSYKIILEVGLIKEIGSHTFKKVKPINIEGDSLKYILLGEDILVSKWKLVIDINNGNVLIIDSENLNDYNVFINSNYFRLVNSFLEYDDFLRKVVSEKKLGNLFESAINYSSYFSKRLCDIDEIVVKEKGFWSSLLEEIEIGHFW